MSVHRFARVVASATLAFGFGLASMDVGGAASAHHLGSRPVCGAAAGGDARCFSHLLTRDGSVVANSTPAGYGPASLQSAYNLPSSTSGAGQNVAIVDAYNDPNAVADVSVYRNQYGLGGCSGTVKATGCTFSNGARIAKYNQSGGTSYPRNNGGWAQEISLDLDMVSAICPKCSITLVEASSASFANLGAAVNEAVVLGANVVSNSYGGTESSSDTSYDTSYYQHPGHVITASSGDGGYGVQYPAASQYVTAVGGTSLRTASNTRGWSETAWSGAGSGCSAYDPKPSWQTSATLCARRAVADVSAVADPNTGVAVYDSFAYQGVSGWLVFGGTSVSSPIVGAVYALAGNTATASTAWSNPGALFDVTSGSNGSCPTLQWCNAGSGWDGPTGLGTPNGTAAF